jgi:hypothetical protein
MQRITLLLAITGILLCLSAGVVSGQGEIFCIGEGRQMTFSKGLLWG